MPRYSALTPYGGSSAVHDTDTSSSGYASSSNYGSDSETSLSAYSHSLSCSISAREDKWSSQPPYMTLYEEEEEREKSTLEKARRRTAGHGVEDAGHDLLDGNTIHYILRLFDSVKGFHEGSLDLTGRHLHRYYSVQARWNAFLRDFMWLSVLYSSAERGEFNASGLPYMDLKVANTTSWHRFQQKWWLPYGTDYEFLLGRCRLTLRALKTRPSPLFQQLCLLDLPVEILEHIFHHASKSEAHAMACTSRLLNNVGRRHIFSNWKLKLGVPPVVRISNPEYSSVDLPTVAQYAKMNLLEEAEFLRHNPHIAKQVRQLLITDEWWLRGRIEPDSPNDTNPFVLSDTFYHPIYRAVPPLLQCTFRMTELKLYSLQLSYDLVQSIFRLAPLRHLTLHLCRIPAAVQASIMFRRVPCSKSLSSLTIVMDAALVETHSQWPILTLCPDVRTLSVRGIGQPGFPLPYGPLWQHCYLHNVERLSLENLDISDIDSLRLWLHMTGASSGLRLTHFRLFTSWGISDADIFGILTSLEGAPLQTLVLEGLATAEFNIFERIAELFPEILALTLVRRRNQNDYQVENRLAVWPHASWEYASYFKRFTRLRRFCWNFWMQHNDATPSALLALENEFSSVVDNPEAQDNLDEKHSGEEESCYFMDSHWIALPFAAYCPSLETLEITGHALTCRITRKPDTGAIMLKTIPVALSPAEWWDA